MAVGLKTDGGEDERVILFVKLPAGQEFSGALDSSEQKLESGEVPDTSQPM